MNIEKLKEMEPFFGSWYVETKISEGKSSKFYKVYKTDGIEKNYLGLKTVKFPSGDRELSNAIASGKYQNVDEYLDILQQSVSKNMGIMRSLSVHNNVVRLENFTIVREASCFYVLMLMELLSPLSDYLSFENVSKNDVVNIGKDICRAIEAFREKGVIHHNITPENIYVDNMGNYKLGDFGLFDYSSNMSEGSLYIAPELYHKNYLRDTSSDIYSLGMLLYKLLNNNRFPFLPPYPAPVSLSDREQSFSRCMRGETFPSPANADFRLTNIIAKATAYRAEDRYFSPLAMLSQLDAYQQPSYTAPAPAVGFEIANDDGIHFDSYEHSQEEAIAEEEVYEEPYYNAEEEQPKKRWYFLVFALVIVLALIVALIVKSGSDGKDKTTTEHTSTTLAPPTQTTTEETTEETTTEETTTEETTTEETTTEESTTEETTTETTTAESTTEETTTEETTTEPFEEPTLVSTDRKNGDKSPDGKTYMKISSYNVEEIPDDEFFDQVLISIGDNLGENLMGTRAYVYQMSGSVLIQKVSADVSCEISEDFGNNILCTVTVDDADFYYEPDIFQYYLCFEEGTIVSDTVITLPLQIRIEQKF